VDAIEGLHYAGNLENALDDWGRAEHEVEPAVSFARRFLRVHEHFDESMNSAGLTSTIRCEQLASAWPRVSRSETAGLDAAVAGGAEGVDREGDQPGGDDSEQERRWRSPFRSLAASSGRSRARPGAEAGAIVAAVKADPDWAEVGKGFVPHIAQNDTALYLYFVIGLLGAAMTPYEVYFYSSGGVEEEWGPKDIGQNQANAIVGYGLGGILSIALMIVGATVFLGHGISPEHLGTIALGSGDTLGKFGLLIALVGILFAVGGASIDTVFAGAYNLAQFCGWEWGRYRSPKGAPRFTLTWFVLLVLAMGIVMTGVDPVVLTEYAVIFSVVALPLTYLPILLVANDHAYMGRYRNGRLANVLGEIYLVVIMVVALTAIP
jgi:Natural resistance-associated macrophage protein-like